MTARLETWNPRFYIIIIEENEDLMMYRMQPNFKKWGIKAFWGSDSLKPDKEKLMQVWYPRSKYTEEYIRSQVIPKYSECPLCRIGKDKLGSKFKYEKRQTSSIKNKIKKDDDMVKIPGLPNLGKVKTFLKDDRGVPLVGQGIAQIPKTLISLGTTDLGSKIINSLLGGIVALANEKTKKNKYVRSMAYNMFWTFADPTANQIKQMKRNWDDILAGLRTHDFRAFQGGIIEDPAEIKAAIQDLIPRMGSVFSKFGSRFGKKFGAHNFTRVRHIDPGEVVQPEITKRFGTSSTSEFYDY